MTANHKMIIRATIFPYDYYHDRYQEYYREGLRRYLVQKGETFEVDSPRFSTTLKKLRQIRYSSQVRHVLGPITPTVNSLIDGLSRGLGAQLPPSPLVSRYTFQIGDEREIVVCIDSQDSRDIGSPASLAESDLYFKTNYWPEPSSNPKIIPFYNCNPLVLRHLATLQAMRIEPPQYDFCLIVRVWGGEDAIGGVEHCVRLLEEASRARGRKYLLAYLVAGDIKSLSERLLKSGIPSTTTPLPVHKLWRVAAQSRVNIIRLGMHQCVPWRLCDLLALGACPVLDQAPKTIWPVPLQEGEHYWNLKLTTSLSRPTADDDSYRRIPDLIDDFVQNKRQTEHIRHSVAEYFDHYLHPDRVGQQICEAVMHRFGRQPSDGSCRT
jgi:hypothetical protein